MANVDIRWADNSTLAVSFRYREDLVESLKATIPSRGRRYGRRVWYIDVAYKDALMSWANSYFDYVDPPSGTPPVPVIGQAEFSLYYLGSAKPRLGADEPIAYGHDRYSWSLSIPLSVLRAWFEPDPWLISTHYAALGIRQGATRQEVKTAYRIAARTWHPDLCNEPGAHEMFLRIKEAYDVLSDDIMRKRYDLGLAWDKSPGSVTRERNELTRSQFQGQEIWLPPVRCGHIDVSYTQQRGQYCVTEIHDWLPIKDYLGRVLVTQWNKAENNYDLIWEDES